MGRKEASLGGEEGEAPVKRGGFEKPVWDSAPKFEEDDNAISSWSGVCSILLQKVIIGIMIVKGTTVG